MSTPISQSSKSTANHKPKTTRAARTCVLHLCPDLEPGDPAREAVDLAVQTQRSGWRALIASNGGSLVTDAERAAVRHTRMPLNRQTVLANWRNRVHLEALIQKEHPALIHAHGIETLPAAYGLCRIHRLPLIVDLTQPLADLPQTKKLLAKLGQISCVIRVPSEYMGQQLLDVFHVAPEQIFLVPPGVDLQWYNAGSISPERLQTLSRLWRLPEQATVVLMPMPLHPGMGHKIFLKALREMKHENIYAVMVGSDRHVPGFRGEIETLINQYGLDGKVIMPDSCTDWPAACWLSSVIIAPNTVPHGQQLELLAAQAIGRPVIVADSGANREMVLAGETAWVIPPDNMNALVAALSEAIHMDTNQRLNLTERTRQFIMETFPQIAWVTAMVELYENLLRPSVRTSKAKAA